MPIEIQGRKKPRKKDPLPEWERITTKPYRVQDNFSAKKNPENALISRVRLRLAQENKFSIYYIYFYILAQITFGLTCKL
jgi:hypothetical protein